MQAPPDHNARALARERAAAEKFEAYLKAQIERMSQEIAELEAKRDQVTSDLATFRNFYKAG